MRLGNLDRAILAVPLLAALVASFIFLTQLALVTGWPPAVAPLLPLCVDALAIMSLRYHRLGRKRAGWIALGAIQLSAFGNIMGHAFGSGYLQNGWDLAPLLEPLGVATMVVGAVPAYALGICVHLTVPKGKASWLAESLDSSVPYPAATSTTATSKTRGDSAAAAGTLTATPAASDTKPRTGSTRSTGAGRTNSGTRKASQQPAHIALASRLSGESLSESQAVLASRFNVSKTTVSKALQYLRETESQSPAATSNGHEGRIPALV
jgi:hypothetical protein